MDLSRLKELIDLMNRHQLEELEFEDEHSRVRLRKRGEKIKEVVTVPAASSAPIAAASTQGAESETVVEEGTIIKSPMVGTFYRAPNPDAEPFVEVGDRFEEGQVLCIIEAMKVMNEIKAEQSGTIEEIYPASAESLEYGQPLFRIA